MTRISRITCGSTSVTLASMDYFKMTCKVQIPGLCAKYISVMEREAPDKYLAFLQGETTVHLSLKRENHLIRRAPQEQW